MRIYTRTGDTGSASLYNGERMTKDTATFAALGDVDELACVLGLAREFTSEDAPAAQPLQQQVGEPRRHCPRKLRTWQDEWRIALPLHVGHCRC